MKPKCLVCGGECNHLKEKPECISCGATFPKDAWSRPEYLEYQEEFRFGPEEVHNLKAEVDYANGIIEDKYAEIEDLQDELAKYKSVEQTPHQLLVEKFMQGAKQEVSETPTLPDENTRLLRAKLILEEAFETVEALGFDCKDSNFISISGDGVRLFANKQPVLKHILDGCVDLRVVTTGTLSACGIKDAHPQYLQDMNNLEKIEKGTLREDGKLIKPPGHQPPDWDKEIERQSKLS